MHIRAFPVPLRIIVVLCLLAFAAACPAAAATPFSIAGTDVSMPANSLGSTQYTVTAIPFTGTLGVGCGDPKVAAGVKIPTCEYGPLHGGGPVTAGQTVTGAFSLYPYGWAVPVSQHRRSHEPWAGLALAGVLLFGFGFRRRTLRALALALLAMAGLSSVSACGGSSSGNPFPMTPGTYQYTLTATNVNPLTNSVLASTTTTVTVTVP